MTAPEAGVPLLFIEVNNCTEEAVLITQKFDKYAQFFQRQEKDTDGIEKPVVHPLVRAPFRGIRAGAPAGPARLPRGRQALRQEPDGQGRRPHPPPLAGPVAQRVASTLTTVASRSWRPRWGCSASTDLPDPRSGGSAAITASRCWTRSATPAATHISPGAARPPRKSSGAARRGKLLNGRRGGRRARTAARSRLSGVAESRGGPTPVRRLPEPGRRSRAAGRSRRTRAQEQEGLRH